MLQMNLTSPASLDSASFATAGQLLHALAHQRVPSLQCLFLSHPALHLAWLISRTLVPPPPPRILPHQNLTPLEVHAPQRGLAPCVVCWFVGPEFFLDRLASCISGLGISRSLFACLRWAGILFRPTCLVHFRAWGFAFRCGRANYRRAGDTYRLMYMACHEHFRGVVCWSCAF